MEFAGEEGQRPRVCGQLRGRCGRVQIPQKDVFSSDSRLLIIPKMRAVGLLQLQYTKEREHRWRSPKSLEAPSGPVSRWKTYVIETVIQSLLIL